MKHALILACALLSACAAPMIERPLPVPAVHHKDLELISVEGLDR